MPRPLHWLTTLAAASAFLLSGCYPESNLCGNHPEPVEGADGGPVGCVRGEDCPLAGTTIVCSNNNPYQRDCMACEASVCVHHVAEICR